MEQQRPSITELTRATSMVELLLKLLDNEQLLSLFEKVVRERTIVKWPADPKDDQERVLLKDLHALILSAGFDRNLASDQSLRDQAVRDKLEQLRRQTGGMIISD